MKNDKTNAIRIVEQNKVVHTVYEYQHNKDEFVDGKTVANLISKNPEMVFKTILLEDKNKFYVCMVPVLEEIDLKKVAKALGLKSVELLPVAKLLSTTGYVRGGCSPIGMKKKFPTIIDKRARNFEKIIFSGGKIGLQIEMAPEDLIKLTDATFHDLTR